MMYVLYVLLLTLITLIFIWAILILDSYDATHHLIHALDKTGGFFAHIPAYIIEKLEL
jgi:hypothetical protein